VTIDLPEPDPTSPIKDQMYRYRGETASVGDAMDWIIRRLAEPRSRRLASNPAEGVTLPRVTPAEKRYLRAEQVAALADAAGPGRLIVLVLAYTGLRWGELAALRVSSVDLMRRRLHIAESMTELSDGRLDWGLPKSHERRWVPVPRFLVDELAEHITGKAPDDLVCTLSRETVAHAAPGSTGRSRHRGYRLASIRTSCATPRRAWPSRPART
jgi:integrase